MLKPQPTGHSGASAVLRSNANVTCRHDLPLGLVIFSLLSLAYLLTFSGEFNSIDELAIYAMTESLVQTRQLDTPQIVFAPYHNPVGVIEPVQSLMAAPLYALAQQFKQVNNIHAVLLSNVFITALTGMVLFVLLRRTGYSVAIACVTALSFGLATTAWPYARTLFREPLVGLLWITAALCLVAWRQSGRTAWLISSLALLGLGIATKIAAIIAVPIFMILIAADLAAQRRRRELVILGGIGTIAVVSSIVGFNWRYGNLPSIAAYTIQYPLLDAILRSYGQLASPAKGLLFFSPVLSVTWPGWPDLWRRQRTVALLIIGMTLGNLYIYGNNSMWYGGLVWGPRFMVPLLPLLIIPLAGALNSGRLAFRLPAMLGALVGLVLQLPIVTADWGESVGQMNIAVVPNIRWVDLRLWARSPALYQLTHWQPEWLNLLWRHSMSDETVLQDIYLGGAIVFLLLMTLVILAISLKQDHPGPNLTLASIGLAPALVMVGCVVLLGRGYHDTRDYPGLDIKDARGLASQISSTTGAPFTVVSVSNEYHIHYWLGLIKGHFAHYWYSPAMTEGFDPVLRPRLPAKVVWLYIDRVHLQPDHSGYDAEYWLNRNAYQINGFWFNGHELIEYLPPGDSLARRPESYVWPNGIALVSVGQPAEPIQAGQGLRIEFEFKRVGPITEDYYWFAHLVRADGKVIPGRDGGPQYGGAPTLLWAEGESITDKRAIAIPLDASPGSYTLYAGFISTTTGERVPITYPDGRPSTDHVELGAVQILPRSAR